MAPRVNSRHNPPAEPSAEPAVDHLEQFRMFSFQLKSYDDTDAQVFQFNAASIEFKHLTELYIISMNTTGLEKDGSK